ncbi:hypothetical protein GS464_00005, partial [Rhodococcus hoagii]|nr:hypothetical protein [Prescottella equi]
DGTHRERGLRAQLARGQGRDRTENHPCGNGIRVQEHRRLVRVAEHVRQREEQQPATTAAVTKVTDRRRTSATVTSTATTAAAATPAPLVTRAAGSALSAQR